MKFVKLALITALVATSTGALADDYQAASPVSTTATFSVVGDQSVNVSWEAGNNLTAGNTPAQAQVGTLKVGYTGTGKIAVWADTQDSASGQALFDNNGSKLKAYYSTTNFGVSKGVMTHTVNGKKAMVADVQQAGNLNFNYILVPGEESKVKPGQYTATFSAALLQN